MDTNELYEKLQGIFPVMPAALTPDEAIDEPAQRRVVDFLIGSKLNGLWVMGSGGEGGILPEAARNRLVEVTAQAAAGRVPVVVGVGETGTRRTLERIWMLEKLGADAAAITPPYYYVHSQEELLAHYRALLDESRLPLVLYNFPAVTKNPLAIETVAALAAHERLVGIKDSSGNFGFALDLIKIGRQHRLRVFVGWEKLLTSALLAGADGAVLFLPNFAPELLLKACDAAKRGDRQTAFALQEKIDSLIPLTGETDSEGIAALKESLALRGLCGRTVARPLSGIAPEHARRIEEGMEQKGLLRERGLLG